MDERITLNSNEKLARDVVGLEGEAKHFLVNGESADKTFKREAQMKFNQKVDDYMEKLNKHEDDVMSFQDKIKDSLDNLEIKAIGINVIVKPFKQNPFMRIEQTESGIITDIDIAPTYKSNETGEWEEEESMIHVGEVVDAGPDCKYLQEGDVVMWSKVSEVPIPFYKQGLLLIPENRVIVVINEGLTKRFNKINN